VQEEGLTLYYIARFNTDQLSAFHATYSSVSQNLGKVFFFDGPAGTGKTFLYKALSYHVRGNGWIALCVAFSGIAGLLLPGGQMAHSTFAIPV
jgi:ATP-dependent DNA helicase PIF1